MNDSWHAAFHPNGSLFATASVNGEHIELWKIEKDSNGRYTFRIHQRLPKEFQPINNSGMRFSPSGKYLPVLRFDSSSHSLFVSLWEVDANQGQGAANILYDASNLAVGEFAPQDVAFGFNENVIVAAFRFSLYVHTLDNPTIVKDSFPGYVVDSISTSPDGKFLAYPTEHRIHPYTKYPVSVRDLLTGQIRYTLLGLKDQVSAVQFSPDGTKLAAADNSTMISIWDFPPEKEPIFLGHKDINTIQFSPDGKVLASASQDGTIKLWKVETGHLMQTINVGQADGYVGGIRCLTFHPNGKLFATVSHGNRVGVAFDIKFWVLKKK